MTATEFAVACTALGIGLHKQDGQLIVTDTKGALNAALRAELDRHAEELAGMVGTRLPPSFTHPEPRQLRPRTKELVRMQMQKNRRRLAWAAVFFLLVCGAVVVLSRMNGAAAGAGSSLPLQIMAR